MKEREADSQEFAKQGSSGSTKKQREEKQEVPVLTFVDMSKLKYLSRSVN